MGGSDTSSTTSSELSPEMQALFGVVTPQVQSTLEAQPLSTLLEPAPQQVAPYSPLQNLATAQAGKLATMPLVPTTVSQEQALLTSPESAATQYLLDTVKSPVGSSTATDQAYQALETLITPTIENEAALAGLGNSTALTDALALAMAEATVPLLTSDIEAKTAAVQPLMDVGATIEGRPTTEYNALFTQAANTFDVGEQQRLLQQAVYDALYADYLRRAGLTEGLVTTTLGGLIPSQIASTTATEGGKTGVPLSLGFNVGSAA